MHITHIIAAALSFMLFVEILFVLQIENHVRLPTSFTDTPARANQHIEKTLGGVPSIYSWFALDPLLKRSGNTCDPRYCPQRCDVECGQIPLAEPLCGMAGMAPCEEDRIISKYFIRYPIFSVNVPLFMHDDMREDFNLITVVQGWYKDAHGSCPSPFAMKGESRCDAVGPYDYRDQLVFTQQRFQRGEVVWVKDGVYKDRPDASFGRYQCWEGSLQEKQESAQYQWIVGDPSGAKVSVKKAFVFMSPVTGDAYFQHFIDRGFSKLAQVIDILLADKGISIIMSPIFEQSHPIVGQILERMGLMDRILFSGSGSIHAEEMLFSCIAPHYHPYSYQRGRQALKLPKDVPKSERKTIVYLTRKTNSRKVENDGDVVSMLMRFANAHGLEVVVFKHSDYPTLDGIIDLFRNKALAMVGPHGGAFYNQLFASDDTLLIEMFPIKKNHVAVRWPEAVWWPAAFFGHPYYFLPCPSTGSGSVIAPLEKIEDILKNELI